MEIVSFTINLEHIGDIVDKNLCELATKKIKRGYQFSPEGAAELAAFHKRVCESLQAAFGIFMTGDVDAARKLLREKAELRKAEIEAADRHFERLREGRPESLETTSLHLDALADLKRIHSHICSVAYPVLEAAGELETDPVRGKQHRRCKCAASPAPRRRVRRGPTRLSRAFLRGTGGGGGTGTKRCHTVPSSNCMANPSGESPRLRSSAPPRYGRDDRSRHATAGPPR